MPLIGKQHPITTLIVHHSLNICNLTRNTNFDSSSSNCQIRPKFPLFVQECDGTSPLAAVVETLCGAAGHFVAHVEGP